MGMYGGGGGSGDLRKQEQERQARIKEGMARINATFDGTRGTGTATSYTAGQKYYDEYGQEWNPEPIDGKYPLAGGAGKTAGRWATRRQMTPEEYRAAEFGKSKVFTGTETSGGFDDSFYAQREKDYLGYTLPNFERQQNAADKGLTYSLARSGLLSSSAGNQKRTDFEIYGGQKRREIADAAAGSANDLRRTVEGQRSQLVSQLQASGDPDSTAQLAMASAKAYRAPTSFQPIGNFFEDWTRNYAANQQARAYDPNVQPLFNFAGAGGGGSSSRIIQ